MVTKVNIVAKNYDQDVLDFIEEHQGQNLANARDGLQAGDARAIVHLGRAGNIEFHLPQHLVRVVNEGNLDFDGLAYAGIRKVRLDSLSVCFVRQLFADLRQIVLTVRILDVGEEFRTFTYQMATTTE